MFANLTNALDFHSKALVVRAQRQQVIASNIANADTPTCWRWARRTKAFD